MSAWNLVVSFGKSFSGEEIERDPNLKIRIPFANQESARQALGQVTLAIERGEPEVIQGQVLAEVPAISAGS